jgi:hypothetical protein
LYAKLLLADFNSGGCISHLNLTIFGIAVASHKQASISSSRQFQLSLAGSVGLAVLLALVMIAGISGCDSSPAGTRSTAAGNSAATVQLDIDFGGRRGNISVDVPCSVDSTVFQILERARNMADLEFYASGAGETTFVRSIDGVENEGAEGDNWVFRVNEKLGNKSCGIFPVQPGDRVLWVLGEYP